MSEEQGSQFEKENMGSHLNDEDLKTWIHKNLKEVEETVSSWRVEARKDYQYVVGNQWDEEDAIELGVLGKPDTVFNRMAPIIDAVQGTFVNSMTEIKYFPREIGDIQVNELYTAAAQWVGDENDQEFEEADIAGDLFISGMGWAEVRMDYIDDPDGKIIFERRSPLKFIWDVSTTKVNLKGMRWVAYEEYLSRKDLLDMWPDKVDEIAPIDNTLFTLEMGVDHTNPEDFYEEEESIWYDKNKGKFRVITFQWYELEEYYRVQDPETGKIVEFSKDRFAPLKNMLDEINVRYIKQKRKHYYQAFISGQTLLERGDCPSQKGFTFKCVTGKRDESKHTWYGIAYPMRSPQEWANKYLSQIQHILATGPKGGLLAEIDAFEDIRDAEEKWAAGDSIIILEPGGLNKIKERGNASYPIGLDKLMEFSIQSIRDVTGISLEMLGMREVNQPGVLEAQRVQKSLTVLARMFSALRLFKKDIGRIYLEFIDEYIADGRLIRIMGEEGEQYVPLRKQENVHKYDIIVSEQAMSVNQKEQVWGMLMSLLPAMLKVGVPIPPSIFDYMPLPNKLASEWKQLLIQSMNQEPTEEDKIAVAEKGSKVELNTAKALHEKIQATKELFSPLDKGSNK